MSYTWDFYTGGVSPGSTVNDCYRGPMTDTEIKLSKPFLALSEFEEYRRLLLRCLVDSSAAAIRTRECVLRVVNSELGPVVPAVYKDKVALQAIICQKRRATVIEEDLQSLPLDYKIAAQKLIDYGLSKESEDLLQAALSSNSPISRVAGYCAVILLATLSEMELTG